MRETKPVRRIGILDAIAPLPHAGADVEIAVLPPACRFAVRVAGGQLPHELVVGFDLALPINRFSNRDDRLALRLGPDEWLLIADAEDSEALGREIGTALAGRTVSIVDVGHRSVALEISGDAAARVLNAGCALDLAPAAFPVGMATRTLLGKAEIILMKLSDEPRFRIEVWRSFAHYLHALLAEAAAGCGD